jgi:hypothetical protein
MSANSSLDSARLAKETLAGQYAGASWYRGVGIAPDGKGYAVRLNVSPAAKQVAASLPKEVRGVRVNIVFIEGYESRSSRKG